MTTEAQKIEGVAAQLYIQQGGMWWSVIKESVRDKWRKIAKEKLQAGEIAGLN